MATATLPLTRTRAGVLYPHAQWYFLAAMASTWLGFSQTYFRVVRDEPMLHHIHGALMGGWILLLVVQPMLYQRGKLKLHRALGRWGAFALVPSIMVVGCLMDRRMLVTHHAPPKVMDQLVFLDLGSLLLLVLFLGLSIYYGRNLQLHARYIVCTVLLLMPPAWGRALFMVPGMHSFQVNLNVALGMVGIAFLLLMVDDVRRGRLQAAYPVAMGLYVAMSVASLYAKGWGWWLGLERWIAS